MSHRRVGIARRHLPLLAVPLLCSLMACGDDDGGATKPDLVLPDAGADAEADATTECEFGQLVSGVCGPEAPRAAAPGDCPAGTIDETVCAPEPPRQAPDDACPADRRDDFGLCRPTRPQLTDWQCPSGFDTVPVFTGDLTVPDELAEPVSICRPQLPNDACDVGTFPVVGFTDCQRLGPACPESEPWPEEAEIRASAGGLQGAVLYVGPAGAAGATGTRADPLDLSAAMMTATNGDIVALATGTYTTPEEGVSVGDGIALVGACAAETVLEGTASDTPSIIVEGNDSLVRQLTIDGPRRGIIVFGGPIGARIEAVAIDGAAGWGIDLEPGAQVALADVFIRDMVALAAERRGAGIRVSDGATVQADRISLDHAYYLGVSTEDGPTNATFSNLLVRGTQPAADGQVGIGLQLAAGGTFSLERAAIYDNRAVGVLLVEDVDAEWTDVTIQGVTPNGDGQFGRGLAVIESSLVGERVVVADATELGLEIFDGDVQLTDAVVRDTQPDVDGGEGRGIYLDAGAQVQLDRTLVLGNHLTGVVIFEAESSLSARDFVVAHTRPRSSDGAEGQGLTLANGAEVDLERALFYRNHYASVLLTSGSSRFSGHDLSIVATQPQPSTDTEGLAVSVLSGSATVERASFRENHQSGVVAATDSSDVTLRDVEVSGTRPSPGDPGVASGVTIVLGATGTLERLAIIDNAATGLLISEEGTDVTATDLHIMPSPSAAEEDLGFGVQIADGASAHLERVVVLDAYVVGVASFFADTELVDAEVRDAVPTADAEGNWLGSGVYAGGTGTLTIRRAVVEGNGVSNVRAASGGTLELLDVAALSGQPAPDGEFGRGISISAGGRVSGSRILVAGNFDCGIAATLPDTTVDLSDVWVRDTDSSPADEQFGRAAVAQFGAAVTLRRVDVVRSRSFGFLSIGEEAVLRAEDIRLRATEPARCQISGSCSAGNGHGVGALDGGLLQLTTFLIEDSEVVGVRVAPGGEVVADTGLISRNLIAINVQNDAFDIDEAFTNVVLLDNDVDLDSQNLPVPSANDVLAEIELE